MMMTAMTTQNNDAERIDNATMTMRDAKWIIIITSHLSAQICT